MSSLYPERSQPPTVASALQTINDLTSRLHDQKTEKRELLDDRSAVRAGMTDDAREEYDQGWEDLRADVLTAISLADRGGRLRDEIRNVGDSSVRSHLTMLSSRDLSTCIAHEQAARLDDFTREAQTRFPALTSTSPVLAVHPGPSAIDGDQESLLNRAARERIRELRSEKPDFIEICNASRQKLKRRANNLRTFGVPSDLLNDAESAMSAMSELLEEYREITRYPDTIIDMSGRPETLEFADLYPDDYKADCSAWNEDAQQILNTLSAVKTASIVRSRTRSAFTRSIRSRSNWASTARPSRSRYEPYPQVDSR